MARWFWSFHLIDPERLNEVIGQNDSGVIRVKPKSLKASYEGTVFIEHDSEAHKNILRNKKLKYHTDYYVVLIHQVSINEMNKFDFYCLFPKAFGMSRLDSNYIKTDCRDEDDIAHNVIPTGIPIFKPPKSKFDICFIDRVIISRKALNIFLNEKINSFDYKPVATSSIERDTFEKMSPNEQKHAVADWWELNPVESETICVYEGPSEICEKCSGWLGETPKYIISIPISPSSKKLIPNKFRTYFPLENFDKKDIQSVKWIKLKSGNHEIIHKRLPIVSKRFLEICKDNELGGYYKPGKKGLADDLFPVEHEKQKIFWM